MRLWDQTAMRPVMTFDLNNSVGDIAWAPYSATTFAAVTADGKVLTQAQTHVGYPCAVHACMRTYMRANA